MSNLSIISTPPPVALIGDGLKFVINSDYISYAQSAELIIDFPDATGTYLDKYFKLVNGQTTLEFFFRTNPDQSGFELRDWESNDYDQFIQNLLDDLNSNFFILKNYILSISTNGTLKGIHFAARKTGSEWNLNLSETNITGVNKSFINYGTDSIIPSDYGIYIAACLINKGEDALPVGEDLISIDANKQINNDISAYIFDQLKTTFTFPFAGNNIITLPDAVKAYFIRYAEYQNAAFGKLNNTFATPLYVLPGGLKQIDRELMADLSSNYFSYGYNAKRFLTFAPLTKKTITGTPERLYFFVQATNLKVMKKAVYADTETTSEIGAFTAPANSVIEIACGTAELFTETERAGLLSFEIWIADATNAAVSEIRTFEIDTEDHANVRTLIFQNTAFEMYDCLQCTGDLTINDNVKRTMIQVLDNDVFRTKVSQAENNASYSLNTGFLPGKESRLWLEDLQLSKDVFLVLGDVLLPITMTTAKIERANDSDNLYSLQITFTPDFNDSRYSSLVGEGVSFVLDANYKIFTDENGVPYVY